MPLALACHCRCRCRWLKQYLLISQVQSNYKVNNRVLLQATHAVGVGVGVVVAVVVGDDKMLSLTTERPHIHHMCVPTTRGPWKCGDVREILSLSSRMHGHSAPLLLQNYFWRHHAVARHPTDVLLSPCGPFPCRLCPTWRDNVDKISLSLRDAERREASWDKLCVPQKGGEKQRTARLRVFHDQRNQEHQTNKKHRGVTNNRGKNSI